MKCQRCPKPATFHITEVLGSEGYKDFHLCEECAQRHLANPDLSIQQGASKLGLDRENLDEYAGKSCSDCGIKFVEFRNSGRLGCPHDYEVFQEELVTLLENIHGDTRHVGKKPHHLPHHKAHDAELRRLKRQLDDAVAKEDYEEAARIRDRIRHMPD